MKNLTAMFTNYRYNLTATQIDAIVNRATTTELHNAMTAYTFMTENWDVLAAMDLRADFERKVKFMVDNLADYLTAEDWDD